MPRMLEIAFPSVLISNLSRSIGIITVMNNVITINIIIIIFQTIHLHRLKKIQMNFSYSYTQTLYQSVRESSCLQSVGHWLVTKVTQSLSQSPTWPDIHEVSQAVSHLISSSVSHTTCNSVHRGRQ